MTSFQAVFLSYAREDSAAAQSIAETLRNHGVEVWFDRSELVGGDAWDAKIRRQIKDCSLFVAVISRNTDARLEGYFRREWKLAIDRTHDMAEEKAFLLPVAIDDTLDMTARVPEKFREVQWIHLPDGVANEHLAHRVQALLEGTASGATNAPFAMRRESSGGVSAGRSPVPPVASPPAQVRPPSWRWWVPLAVVLLVVGGAAAVRFWPKAVKPAAAPNARVVPQPGRPKGTPAVRPSEARQLSAKATALWEKWDDATHADWTLAEELCKRAVELDPADGEAWAVYAQVACGQYEFSHSPTVDDLARARAERAVRLLPNSKTARLALANAYRTNLSTLPEAERLLRELLAAAPKDKRVLRTLGETLRAQGRFDDALTCFEQAAELPGGDPLALLARSFTLAELGRYADAEKAADESITHHPGPAALLRKMECQLDFRGDLAGAAETLAKVPASSLLDDRAVALACQLWFWKRQPEKCLAALGGATCEFLPGNYWNGAPRGWLTGRVHQLGDRLAAAEAHWRTALKTIDKAREEDPEEVDLIFWGARVHACLGEKAEAEKMLELARQLSNGTAVTPSTIVAAIEVLLGRTSEALALLESMTQAATGPLLRVTLRFDPVFDPLRGNPRFEKLLEEPKGDVPR